MKEKIKNYFEEEEKKYQEEMDNCIISTITPTIYINMNVGEPSFKLEKAYEYCHKNGYDRITMYSDVGSYDLYEDLIDTIADGGVEKLILYSLYDLPDDIYSLLYWCEKSDTKVELITFDEQQEYLLEHRELLKYMLYAD